MYHNEKLSKFVDSLTPDEQVVAHKILGFIKSEFPDCNEILRGELIHEEII